MEEQEIKKAMKVEILTRDKKKVIGIVEEIGTKESERGRMVLLKSGEVGRVQKIIDEKKLESETEKLIKKGENYQREFKGEALWSLNYTNQQINESKSNDLHTHQRKASKVILAKSIAALLNSEGGNLIIGVKENKETGFEIIGIEKDIEKLKALGKDFSLDGYKRMIIDDIIRAYFPYKIYNQLNEHIIINFDNINGKIVCNIRVKPSKSKVFLNLDRKTFMIRTATETRQIQDEELVDYCMRRFLS